MIKGINKLDYPILYAVVERNLIAYNLKEVNIKVTEIGDAAAAYSFWKDTVTITTTFLEILTEDELDAIIAHEFSHLYNRDGILTISILFIFVLPPIILFSWVYQHFFLAIMAYLDYRIELRILGSVLILVLFSVGMVLFGFKFNNFVSIQLENRADWDAIRKTKNPKALKTALFKFQFLPLTKTKNKYVYFTCSQSYQRLVTESSINCHPFVKFSPP